MGLNKIERIKTDDKSSAYFQSVPMGLKNVKLFFHKPLIFYGSPKDLLIIQFHVKKEEGEKNNRHRPLVVMKQPPPPSPPPPPSSSGGAAGLLTVNV